MIDRLLANLARSQADRVDLEIHNQDKLIGQRPTFASSGSEIRPLGSPNPLPILGQDLRVSAVSVGRPIAGQPGAITGRPLTEPNVFVPPTFNNLEEIDVNVIFPEDKEYPIIAINKIRIQIIEISYDPPVFDVPVFSTQEGGIINVGESFSMTLSGVLAYTAANPSTPLDPFSVSILTRRV